MGTPPSSWGRSRLPSSDGSVGQHPSSVRRSIRRSIRSFTRGQTRSGHPRVAPDRRPRHVYVPHLRRHDELRRLPFPLLVSRRVDPHVGLALERSPEPRREHRPGRHLRDRRRVVRRLRPPGAHDERLRHQRAEPVAVDGVHPFFARGIYHRRLRRHVRLAPPVAEGHVIASHRTRHRGRIRREI